jgi:hypothetical protein
MKNRYVNSICIFKKCPWLFKQVSSRYEEKGYHNLTIC